MKRMIALLAAGALLVSGCESQKPREEDVVEDPRCTDASCPAGQFCNHDSGSCEVNQPPTVQITAPKDGAWVSGESLTVEGLVADDLAELRRLELSVDQGKTWTPLVPDATGAFTSVIALPRLDAQVFGVEVRVEDDLGQPASAEVSVTVDNVAPKCAPVSPMAGQVFAMSSGPAAAVKFSATDGSGLVTQAQVDFADGTGPQKVTVTEGVASVQWTLPALDHVTRTATFTAADASGNACEAKVSFVVDTVAPKIAFAPGQPSLIGGSAAMHTFTGSVSDGSGTTTVTFDFGDGQGPRGVQLSTGAWGVQVPLPDEDYVTHTLTAQATDLVGNVATASSSVIVDRVAPRLSFIAPVANQRFNLATTPSSGQVEVRWDVMDGDPSVKASFRQLPATTWTAAPGNVTFVTTLATDNPRTYEVEAEVVDTVGLRSTAAISFSVDRVAPTITSVSVANGTRMAPRELTVTFSEAVTVATPDELVIPNAGIGGGPGATQTLTELLGDTVYTTNLAAGLAVDAYGNPNVAGTNVTFHTEPATPVSGYTVPLNVDTGSYAASNRFDARADEDGVVSLAFISPNGMGRIVTFGWFDPKTGLWAQLDANAVVAPPVNDLAIVSHREVSGLSATRVRGFSLQQAPFMTDNWTVRWFDGLSAFIKSSSGTPPVTALVPVPPAPADNPGAPVGWVRNDGTFERPGTGATPLYTQATGIPAPRSVAAVAPTLWHVFGLNGSTLQSTHRYCAPSGLSTACNFGPVQNVSSSLVLPLRLSHAFPGTRGLLTFESTSGVRSEACIQTCTAQVCPVPPPPVVTTSVSSEGLRVAPAWNGQKVLGARKTASGIELLEKDLSGGCSASWVSLGLVPASAGPLVTEWRPVMFAKKPGVIYLDGATLKVWVK